jgi:hypothetical protein
VLDVLDSRRMTDAGPLDEFDVESDEDLGETCAVLSGRTCGG